MDVDYARLAMAVPLPEGIKNVPKTAPKSAVIKSAHQAYTSPPPEEVNVYSNAIVFFFLLTHMNLTFLFFRLKK